MPTERTEFRCGSKYRIVRWFCAIFGPAIQSTPMKDFLYQKCGRDSCRGVYTAEIHDYQSQGRCECSVCEEARDAD